MGALVDIYKLHEIAGKGAPKLAFELFDIDHLFRHDPDTKGFFNNSSLDPGLRMEVFDKLCPEASGTFRKTIELLINEDLMGELPWLAEKFAGLVSEKDRADVAEIKVAFKPDPAFLERIKGVFGKGLMMKVVVDPGLIGGFLLRYHDGRTFDGSLKGKLSMLRTEMAA